jgi:2-dehydro-3-deoxyphosphogluconate aldolase / (4S)-4-hydroxy-2-oxoglutarate aldolase
MNLVTRLGQLGVIPVVKIDRASLAPKMAEALLAGGLPCAEITFRTGAAEESLKQIATTYPEVVLGAGTVLTLDQAQRAVQAGARYIVSPGFDRKVVAWCLTEGIPVMPGVATPTEIQMALDSGLSILKFFPAEALGGIPLLEAIAAPFVDVRFVPTGGITPANLADYLRLPMVHAVGGSWLVSARLLTTEGFGEITRLARQATEIVAATRMKGGQP